MKNAKTIAIAVVATPIIYKHTVEGMDKMQKHVRKASRTIIDFTVGLFSKEEKEDKDAA